jgi:hypothetical protein
MNPQITVADMCTKHQTLLIHQAKYSEKDPWRALIIAAQITLFQAATIDPRTYEKISGDISNIGKLGCLACYKPDAFGEVVEAAKTHDLGKIKALGEMWLHKAEQSKAEGNL